MTFDGYVREVQRELSSGVAREHAYRPALKALLESLEPGLSATNEPRRTSVGTPDYVAPKPSVRKPREASFTPSSPRFAEP